MSYNVYQFMDTIHLKKFFAPLALSLVLFSAVFVPIVSAQDPMGPQQQPTTPNYVQPNNNPTQGPQTNPNDPMGLVQSSGTFSQDQNEPAAPGAGVGKGLQCDDLFDITCGIVKVIGFMFTFVPNLIATVAGIASDFAIWYSIQSGPYQLINPFMESGWKLIRDFTNLGFIFALFFAAFNLIFNRDTEKTNPKRTVAWVIIMAILINFSFFMSRIVIEAGNMLTTVLYSKIETSIENTGQADANANAVADSGAGDLGTPSSFFSDNNFSGMKSISIGILNQVNPQKLILTNSATSPGAEFYIVYIFLAVMSGAFNLVMTYIFISILLLFVGRFIGLALSVILSPLAFVSVAIPDLKNKNYIGFDDWIKQLVGMSFMAPVYMVFLYLTVMFLKVHLPTGGGLLLEAVFVFIKLSFVAFILLRGKKMATDMSGHIGEMAGGLINSAAMIGVGVATGGTGFLARNTVGRLGGALATNGSIARVATGGSANVQRMQNWMGSSMRKIGVGNYRLGNTKMGSKMAAGVEQAQISQRVAQGVRSAGKNLRTVNPLDRSVAGFSARKAAGYLGTISGNKDLNTGLAKDYAGQIKASTMLNRAMDIKAGQNAQKTITNVSQNAIASGLGDAARGGGGSTTSNTTSGPITVTGSNTGAVPNVQGWSGAKGPVPGVRIPNDFTGMKLAPKTVTPQLSGDGAAAVEAYDKDKQIQANMAAANGGTGNVTIDTLNVNKLNMNGGAVDGLSVRPGSMGKGDAMQNIGGSSAGRATTLLSAMNSAAMPVLNYSPKPLTNNKPVETPSPQNSENGYDQYKNDQQKIGEIAGGVTQALSPENLQKMFQEKNDTKAEVPKNDSMTPIQNFDQTSIVSENLPGDFGGIQLPPSGDNQA